MSHTIKNLEINCMICMFGVQSKHIAIGLVIALIFAALPMVWGTAFVLPNVGTTLLTSLTVSTSLKTGVASVDYIKNNKVKSKDEWKEGGELQKETRQKIPQNGNN